MKNFKQEREKKRLELRDKAIEVAENLRAALERAGFRVKKSAAFHGPRLQITRKDTPTFDMAVLVKVHRARYGMTDVPKKVVISYRNHRNKSVNLSKLETVNDHVIADAKAALEAHRAELVDEAQRRETTRRLYEIMADELKNCAVPPGVFVEAVSSDNGTVSYKLNFSRRDYGPMRQNFSAAQVAQLFDVFNTILGTDKLRILVAASTTDHEVLFWDGYYWTDRPWCVQIVHEAQVSAVLNEAKKKIQKSAKIKVLPYVDFAQINRESVRYLNK